MGPGLRLSHEHDGMIADGASIAIKGRQAARAAGWLLLHGERLGKLELE